MWLWGANQLVLWEFYNESEVGNILSYMWPFYKHNTTNIDIKLGLHWQMTHVEFDSDVVHLDNIEQ